MSERDFTLLEPGEHRFDFKGDLWALAVSVERVEVYDQEGDLHCLLVGSWSKSQIQRLLVYGESRWTRGVEHGKWMKARELRLALGAADREEGA